MKKCIKCGGAKPLADFYKNHVSKDGHQPLCKACDKAKAKAWAQTHPRRVAREQPPATTTIRALLGLSVGDNLKKHKVYRTWTALKNRSANHPRYVEKGVRVHAGWLGVNGFLTFMKDMGPPPTPLHTIERVDNDGDYTPDNCVWATKAQQNRNKGDTYRIRYEGGVVCAKAAADLVGAHACVVYRKLRNGEAVFSTEQTGG